MGLHKGHPFKDECATYTLPGMRCHLAFVQEQTYRHKEEVIEMMSRLLAQSRHEAHTGNASTTAGGGLGGDPISDGRNADQTPDWQTRALLTIRLNVKDVPMRHQSL